MRSRPFSSFTNAGGAYVLGGVERCPQVSRPLFSGDRFVAGPGGDSEEGMGKHGERGVPVPGPRPFFATPEEWHAGQPILFTRPPIT
jgi:hypothetical protein